MPNVLIFESDLEFANVLKTELSNRACNVSIVEDATVGLQQAASAPPDLILLCTELPRMNGFSVCNRLKRDPNLQDVPVIIMSANASDETFQQHRNLPKKRADDYVHKPLSFEALLPHIEALLPLDGSARRSAAGSTPLSSSGEGGAGVEEVAIDDVGADAAAQSLDVMVDEDDDIELDEFEEIDDDLVDDLIVPETTPDAPPAAALSEQSATGNPAEEQLVGDESDESLAESAFDALMVDDPDEPGEPVAVATSTPEPKSLVMASEERVPSAPPPKRSTLPPLRSNAPPAASSDGAASNSAEVAQLRNELAIAQERLLDLESNLTTLRQADEKLHQDLDEARARLASGATGPKAKDILDLREALNNKDRELLELREQLNRREKELVAAKDGSLEFERKNADLAEKVIELDKQMHSAERAQNAAIQDREQAAKRAEEFKRKLEKVTEESAHKNDELRATVSELDRLTGELASSQSELGSLRAERDSLTAERNELTQRLTEIERSSTEQLQQLRDEQSGLQKRLEESEARLEQSQQQAAETLAKLDQERASVSSAADAITLALDKLREISQ